MMLKSHKIHEEQIAGIAKSMKELYQMRRSTTAPPGNNGIRIPATTRKDGFAGNRSYDGSEVPEQKNPGHDSLIGAQEQHGPAFRKISSASSLQAIRCFKCGDDFPITDFLYTKKTGLCIPCWEAKIKVT